MVCWLFLLFHSFPLFSTFIYLFYFFFLFALCFLVDLKLFSLHFSLWRKYALYYSMCPTIFDIYTEICFSSHFLSFDAKVNVFICCCGFLLSYNFNVWQFLHFAISFAFLYSALFFFFFSTPFFSRSSFIVHRWAIAILCACRDCVFVIKYTRNVCNVYQMLKIFLIE